MSSPFISMSIPSPRHRSRWSTGLLCLAAAVTLTVICGCETAPRTTGSLNQALTAFDAHRYSTSHTYAVEAMRTSTGRDRDQAAYLAGLSAYLLGNIEEAELRLVPASQSSDAATAVRAKAMLGQVRLDQNRPSEAAMLFEQAARGLNGADARQAARYASIAHRQAGNDTAASQWSNTMMAGANGGAFALQVGAFQDQRRASEAARAAEAVALADGLGPVHVVPRSDARGRSLYLVQFGRFDTRTAAASARNRLGRLDYIVAPVATP